MYSRSSKSFPTELYRLDVKQLYSHALELLDGFNTIFVLNLI